jgi:hypothetical protein
MAWYPSDEHEQDELAPLALSDLPCDVAYQVFLDGMLCTFYTDGCLEMTRAPRLGE